MAQVGTSPVTDAASRSEHQTHRSVPLKEILEAARAWSISGIDRAVWIFILAHGCLLALLLLSDTDLSRRAAGALMPSDSLLTWDRAFLALVIASLALHACLFRRLYRSDPGWVNPGESNVIEEGSPLQKCPHCGAIPPERSRHDFNTGRCVAKYDHFCPLIASSVGDLNHSLFWFYCTFQAFLIAWAWFVCLDAVMPCLSGSQSETVSCWLLLGATVLLVPLFNFFGGLALLHAYLTASGRTSYEICKGAKVPYLKPYYDSYKGPAQFALGSKGLGSLLRELRKGNAPPAPYSVGAAENLNVTDGAADHFILKPSESEVQPISSATCFSCTLHLELF
ncbi:hypothetical protein WJX75_008810 [Coccomyxa subellipsoidea]|uniref:S-acyltransferase n=1 Tax=Coccomyxa subellipsoidea TaxID=248742 RepID=A0ABR2YYZ1_9CHLO